MSCVDSEHSETYFLSIIFLICRHLEVDEGVNCVFEGVVDHAYIYIPSAWLAAEH